MWTTNGNQADWMCLLANTGGSNPHLNKSLLCVPMNTPGITKSPPIKKLGMRSSDTIQTFFDNVKVPQKYRIGDEGKGFIYQMNQFQDERLVAGVQGAPFFFVYFKISMVLIIVRLGIATTDTMILIV